MATEESLLDQLMTAGGGEGGIGNFLSVLSDISLNKLMVTSELPPPAVIPWAVTSMIASRMNSKVLKGFMTAMLRAQLIKDRRRAGELVELFQTVRARMAEED